MSTDSTPTKEVEKRKRDEGFSPYKKLAVKRVEMPEKVIGKEVIEKEIDESSNELAPPKRKELKPMLVKNVEQQPSIPQVPVVFSEYVFDVKIDQLSRQKKGRKPTFAYHVIEKTNGDGNIQREFSERTTNEMIYYWDQGGFQLYRTNMVNVTFSVKKAGMYRLSLVRRGNDDNKLEFVPFYIQGLGERKNPADYCCAYIVRSSQQNGQIEFNFHLRRSYTSPQQNVIGNDMFACNNKSKYARFQPELRKHQFALWYHSDLNKILSDDLKDWTFLSMSETFEIFSQPKSVKIYSVNK